MSSSKTSTFGGREPDFFRGVWELARLHTREAWLCWYPAIWGACMAAGAREMSLDTAQFIKIIFGIVVSVTATHGAFCTFNDICDRNFDLHVERCKTRPIPSGMISTQGAIVTFITWLPVCFTVTYYTLGIPGVITFVPVWVLSTVYPFMKRVIPFPQVILGAVIGGAVFPGYATVTQDLAGLEVVLPLFFATASWVVYFDVFYATQDSADDKKIGVKSLAVLMGSRVSILLAVLGAMQIFFFTMTALDANLSFIFWAFGLGVWTLNIPWHVISLDLNNPKSGGKIFKDNIKLGLWLTVVVLVELIYTRVLSHNQQGLAIGTFSGVKPTLVDTFGRWNTAREL